MKANELYHQLADQGDKIRRGEDYQVRTARLKTRIEKNKQEQQRQETAMRKHLKKIRLIARERDELIKHISEILGLNKEGYQAFFEQWEDSPTND